MDDYCAYYLYQDEDGTIAWYPGRNVMGWIKADSESVAVENKQKYMTMRVTHTGVVQIGPKVIPEEFQRE